MKSIHTDSYRGFRGCCFVAGEVTENQPGIAVVSAEDREALLHFYELYKYEWYNRWALDGLLQEAVSELHGGQQNGAIYLFGPGDFAREVCEGVRRAERMIVFAKKEMHAFYDRHLTACCFNYPSPCYRLCCIWGLLNCRSTIMEKLRSQFLPSLEQLIWDDPCFNTIKKSVCDYRLVKNAAKTAAKAQGLLRTNTRLQEENGRLTLTIEQLRRQLEVQKAEAMRAEAKRPSYVFQAPVGQVIGSIDKMNANTDYDGSERR